MQGTATISGANPQTGELPRRGIRPSARLVGVLCLFVAASALLSWGIAIDKLSANVWIGLSALLCMIAGADAWGAIRRRRESALVIKVRRIMPHAFALGVARDISIRLVNGGARELRLVIFDFTPTLLRVEGMPCTVRATAGEEIEINYRVLPIQRGPAAFGYVDALIDSPWGLWQAGAWLGTPETVRVYPNFAAVAKFALLATDHRLSRLGIKLKRRRGAGLDFHQLREYREGDSLRQIDWKATTRQGKLISREYQDERDQRVVFLLDCSRRMRAQDGDLSHFDYVLNSMMLLAHVALKQGDSVGALSFGGVERFFAPAKGAATLNALTNTFYDIEPQANTGDYLGAAQRLMRDVPKRTLVILLTNLRDEDEDELALATRVLSAKHLVVVASLRESVLREMSSVTVSNLDDALAVSATHHYLEQRRAAFARLTGRETLALDVEPKELPIALVNQYLEIKRSGRL